MKRITLGSLFDGIGGFPLAAQRCGIKTVWASEIEKNCIEITKRHFPRVQQLGDLTKISGKDILPVDIISFGSPCQDLSIAGGQKGLDGERSGLFREAIRIIYEMREATNGKQPTFIIWENVPGAFSSNKGNDFRTVLEEITKTSIPMPKSGRWATAGMVGGREGGASVAWRQLDSQYWGVPQRRKRIFLVGDFRTESTPQILFECESVLGYVKKGRKEREKVAGAFISSIENTSGEDKRESVIDFGGQGARVRINADKSATLCGFGGGGGAKTGLYLINEATGFLDRNSEKAHSIGYENEKSPCLRASMTPSVISTHPINLQVATRHKKLGEGTGLGVGQNEEPAYTLQAAHSHGVFATYEAVINDQGGSVMDISENGIVPTLRAQTHGHPPITFAVYPIRDPQLNQNANGFIISPEGEPSPTLSATDRHAVAFFEAYQHHGYRYAEKTGPPTSGQNSHIRGDTPIIQKCYTPSSHGNYAEGIGTLRANGGDYGGGSETLIVVFKKLAFYVKYSLRKLTPLECERLQGFPDNWTKYNTKGEQIADTPRYVALGNSLAVPCAERVFRGIVAVMRGGL